MSDPISPLIDALIENPGSESQTKLQEALKPYAIDELALVLEPCRWPAGHCLAHIPQDMRLDVLVALRGEARLLLLRNLPSDELPKLFEDLGRRIY